MIKRACRECEEWKVKDMIYIVGVINDSTLSSLCMVYGVDYAADAETYEQIKEVLKNGVESIEGNAHPILHLPNTRFILFLSSA